MTDNWYQHLAKRTVDLLIVVPAIIFLSPLLGIIALLVRINLGSPIIFRQQRPGLFCQPFTIFKFRTMRNGYDTLGNLLPDKARQTPLGNLLRQTSLDELPELFNILKGEMSVVGPRPLLMKYVNRYGDDQIRRHAVKPGLSGWAQINGRNAISWDEKLKHDIWYVDNWSLFLDLKIIFLTIWKVLKREGISQPGQVGMAEFIGNRKNGTYPLANNSSILINHSFNNNQNGLPQERLIFDPEFKANMIIDLISGIKRSDEICREHALDPYTLARWYGEFLEKMAIVFKDDRPHSWTNTDAAELENLK